ncbi:SAPS-domain-containing protein [Eremomyces bilateralis CBS 781.70]|uniref:SAPS-domain-containing protein n=1 Tax=Eremomyces bilateralis CBS 781.70 TaxID=1392243 RepID=A0A6G1G2T4_9PEZI|nr:SAPS-domain-containing protein [Eremomyces bilateralis CBS 781.70]KAF1812241.1 SAPS-domain-containing protein [Eremomyces bilateralis CBS 781.70]
MFWRFGGGYANISTLDSILDKPDVTLEELLDESDLIQELKQQNSKLIEYLRDDNILDRLLRYVVALNPEPTPDEDEPSPAEKDRPSSGGALDSFFSKGRRRSRSKSLGKDDGDGEESKEEKQRLKYAYVASEILSSEVWSISEALMENQESLRKFWDYAKQEPPLDAVQAGYFMKVNESLLDRKTEEMLDLFKSIDNIIPDMLQHVDCPMIMDLLLKIISLEKAEGGQGIVDWLQTKDMIPILLSYLSSKQSSSTQTSAGDFLKAIITISANATSQDQSVIGPNELTRQLVSEECIGMLINEMLGGGNPLTVGVGIVIEVIRKNNSDYDMDNQIGPVPKSSDPIYLGTLLRQFAQHIPDFMSLIQHTAMETVEENGVKVQIPKKIKSAFGEPFEPLGFDRFKTCELMAELLHCSNMALLNERGAEMEIRARDAERARLKAEGKLTSVKESALENDFGTSVDSSGFHHARRPSSLEGSPELIKRLEVSNSGEEDEFEKVAASDVYGEEVETDPGKDDTAHALSEKDDLSDGSSANTEKVPNEKAEENESATEKAAEDTNHDGPTSTDTESSGSLSERLDQLKLEQGLGLDTGAEPTTAAEFVDSLPPGEETDTDRMQYEPSFEISAAMPAPLFSSKPSVSNNIEHDGPASKEDAMDETEKRGTDTGTEFEDSQSSHSVILAGPPEEPAPPFEVDVDGAPVVGDFLKIQFVENRVVPTILDFFFRFPWNNFLHNVVYDVVQQVFNGQMERGFNRSLAIDLFDNGRITERIIDGQEASDKAQEETNIRLGYMGHLTLIAEEVVKFTERHPPELLSQSVLERVMSDGWVTYVEQTLTETRERDNAILGGVRPDLAGGPRQAVLNAVNSAQGYDGGSSGLAALMGQSSGSNGLETLELAGDPGAGGYTFGGNTLLSGFNHSSDEEDEEGDEGGVIGGSESGEADVDDRETQPLSESDQPKSTPPIAIPPPLQVAPSRARRQFAARLAQRQKELEAANAASVDGDPVAGEDDDDEKEPDHDADDVSASQVWISGPPRLGDRFRSGSDDGDDEM